MEHAENRSKETPMSEPPAVLRYGERELELPTIVGTDTYTDQLW